MKTSIDESMIIISRVTSKFVQKMDVFFRRERKK